MKFITALLLTILMPLASGAAAKISFVGYQKGPKAPTRNLHGPIHKFLETDSDFKLIIGDNAAFYLLPKDAKSKEIRAQLESLQKSKTPVDAVVNAFSRQILTLESSK